MKAKQKGWRGAVAAAALLGALIASLAIAVAPAAAEEAPGFLDFQPITSASAPEEYSWVLHLQPGETLVQVNETEVAIWDGMDSVEAVIVAAPARDADGAAVPVTLRVDPEDVLTEVVHHAPSDPASGGSSFAYPITAGESSTTGAVSVSAVLPPGSLAAATQTVIEANPPAVIPPFELNFTPRPCRVPKLAGLSRHAAAAKLSAAHCTLGKVHLATGATAGKGKVVKQFQAAGTELAPGAPVAVKLGAAGSR
jgi:hypothetical protein